MDWLRQLARQTKLSPEDAKLVSQLSKEEIKAWLKNHKECREYVDNLHLMMALHENDQLQLTTYFEFCADFHRFSQVIKAYGTQQILPLSNPPSEESMTIASDVLNVLIPFYHSDKLKVVPLCLFIQNVHEELPYNKMSLAPLIPHLVTSPYKVGPWQLHDFLKEFVELLFCIDRSQRPTQEEFIFNQKDEFVKVRNHHQYLFFVEVLKIMPFSWATPLMVEVVRYDLVNTMMFQAAFLDTGDEKHADWCHEYLDNTFRSALRKENCKSEDPTSDVIRAILRIRHLCLDQVRPHYSSYAHWFSNLQIKSREEFEYFFVVLSKIVPHENATTLKIHINKAPTIPSNCQTIFSDYCQLAKTQLIDMKETTEYMGLFGTTEQEDRRQDVLKVLSHFRETGEIAPILLKACVFRREYYRDVFLRDLITFDIGGDEEKVVLMRFVETLRETGKLPSAMYDEWALRSVQV